jgi:hypothetical protein
MVTIEKKLATSVLPQLKLLQLIEQAVEKTTVNVSVREIVGTRRLDQQKGRTLAEHLLPFLQQKRQVTVSLQGVFMLFPGFLWGLFVILYRKLPVDTVENNLHFTDLKDGDQLTIEEDLKEAKLYVFHRDVYEKAHRNTLEWAVDMGYFNEEDLIEKMEEF